MLSLLASTLALPLIESAAHASPHHEPASSRAFLTIENRSSGRVTVYVDRD